METLQAIWDFVMHVDQHLGNVIAQYGTGTYLILFTIIFCETGLVIFPFLPGDSLLFAAGLFSRPERGSLNPTTLFFLLASASIIGDNTNFHIGRFFGRKLFKSDDARFFKKSHLEKTREFYERHGAKTIVIGRFVPIVRTLAPFVAGMDAMPYNRFLPLSVIGAITWVGICVYAGYFFGGIPWVTENFSIVVMLIVGASLGLIFVEFFRSAIKSRRATK